MLQREGIARDIDQLNAYRLVDAERWLALMLVSAKHIWAQYGTGDITEADVRSIIAVARSAGGSSVG